MAKMMSKAMLILVLGLFILPTACSTENTATPEPIDLELSLDQYLQPENWIDGIVDLRNNTLLSFQVSGKVEQLFVEEGDTVKSGELIATIDSYQLEINKQRSEVALSVAEVNLEQVSAPPHLALISEAESDVEAAQAQTSVGIVQETIRAAEVKAAQSRLDYLLDQPFPEEVAIAQANVDRAMINLEEAESLLEQTKLIAPMDGSILQVFVNSHEFAGEGTPILRIGNPKDLVVKSQINDIDIVGIDVSEKLIITFAALPGVEIQGVVLSILPELENGDTGLFNVSIELDEIPIGVRWGMTAQVHIP